MVLVSDKLNFSSSVWRFFDECAVPLVSYPKSFKENTMVELQAVINLNGRWTDGSPRHAVISVVSPSNLTIDMSAFNRPAASGSVIDSSTIAVTFPDDATYIGKLQPPNTIRWSNNSAWTKV
jgi:hypothetical protein